MKPAKMRPIERIRARKFRAVVNSLRAPLDDWLSTLLNSLGAAMRAEFARVLEVRVDGKAISHLALHGDLPAASVN